MAMRWIPAVLGLWLILSPFVLSITGAGRWNNIIIGIVIAALGYTSAREPAAS